MDIIPNEDSLNIETSCPIEKLPLALNLMKDILFSPYFDQKKFNKTKEEIKLNLSGMQKNAEDRAIETLYPNQPYGHSFRKISEEIDNVTLADVIQYYNNLISNAQARVMITGKITPNVQNEIFSSLQQPGTPFFKPYHTSIIPFDKSPSLKNTQIITEAENRNQAQIVQVFKLKNNANIKERAAISLINQILGGHSNSRLFMDLRESQKIAPYKVKSYHTTDGKTGELTFEVKVDTNDPKNIQTVVDGYKRHVDDLKSKPINDEELKTARRIVKSNLILNTQTAAGKNLILNSSINTLGGDRKIEQLMREVDKVTTQDIMKTAKRQLSDPSVISIIASDKALKENEQYLSTLGSLKKF